MTSPLADDTSSPATCTGFGVGLETRFSTIPGPSRRRAAPRGRQHERGFELRVAPARWSSREELGYPVLLAGSVDVGRIDALDSDPSAARTE